MPVSEKLISMIRNLILVTFFLLIFVFGCRQKEKSSLVVINPGTFIEKDIVLSELSDSIHYVSLASNLIFRNITDLEFSNDRFYLGVNPANILVYDWNGTLINTIGHAGRGPGEYNYTLYLTLNSAGNIVYLRDLNKINKYTISGDFLNSNSLPVGLSPSNIVYFNDKIYLFCNITNGQAKYNWVVLDTLGNVCSFKLNSIPEFESQVGFSMKTFSDSNSLYYWNHYNDTIFRISKDGYKAYYLFSHGEFRLPTRDITISEIINGKFLTISDLISSKNYLFLSYSYNKIAHTAFLDKISGKFFQSENYFISENKRIPGFINDIDCGLPFTPKYIFNKNGSEYLMDWYSAFDIKNYVSSDAFKKSIPKFPEKKKELENLASSLNENDNPVLMLVKLK